MSGNEVGIKLEADVMGFSPGLFRTEILEDGQLKHCFPAMFVQGELDILFVGGHIECRLVVVCDETLRIDENVGHVLTSFLNLCGSPVSVQWTELRQLVWLRSQHDRYDMVDRFGNWFAHERCTSILCLNEQWHCQALFNPNKMVEEDMTIEETMNDSGIDGAFCRQSFNSGCGGRILAAGGLDKIVEETRNFDRARELPAS